MRPLCLHHVIRRLMYAAKGESAVAMASWRKSSPISLLRLSRLCLLCWPIQFPPENFQDPSVHFYCVFLLIPYPLEWRRPHLIKLDRVGDRRYFPIANFPININL